MNVTGSAVLSAPPEEVWAALRDPGRLARMIPGCERLEITGVGRCSLTMTTAMAAVGGRYVGEVAISEQEESRFRTVHASGSGSQGTVTADVTVRLKPAAAGVTRL